MDIYTIAREFRGFSYNFCHLIFKTPDRNCITNSPPAPAHKCYIVRNIRSSDIRSLDTTKYSSSHHLKIPQLHYRYLRCVITSIPHRQGLLWRKPYWTLRNPAGVHQFRRYRLLWLELWLDWLDRVGFSELEPDYHYCHNSKCDSNNGSNHYAHDSTDG